MNENENVFEVRDVKEGGQLIVIGVYSPDPDNPNGKTCHQAHINGAGELMFQLLKVTLKRIEKDQPGFIPSTLLRLAVECKAESLEEEVDSSHPGLAAGDVDKSKLADLFKLLKDLNGNN